MSVSAEPTFEVARLLPELGFVPCSRNDLNDWKLKFGPLELEVVDGLDRFFEHALCFAGTFYDGRTASMLEFCIGPLSSDREQALALISYHLRNLPPLSMPDWVTEGWALAGHLPWEREAREQRALAAAAPKCMIAPEWFRLPCKALRELAEKARADEVAQVGFDGQILRISVHSHLLVMPGEGNTWNGPVSVPLLQLRQLPKRIMKKRVEVVVWEDSIVIAGVRFEIVKSSAAPLSTSAPSE